MLLDIYICAAVILACIWLAVVAITRKERRAITAEFKSADVSHSLRKKKKKP